MDCNLCGLTCDLLEGPADDLRPSSHGLIEQVVIGHNASTPGNGQGALDDMTGYRFSLCEFCLDWLFCRFRLPPKVFECNLEGGLREEEPWRPAAQRVADDVWREGKDAFFVEKKRRDAAREARSSLGMSEAITPDSLRAHARVLVIESSDNLPWCNELRAAADALEANDGLENRARASATLAHAAIKHVRKYTGEPYCRHPAAVAELVRSVPHTEEMLAAAHLHDTVEDCGVGLDIIAEQFGPKVAALVAQMTDVSRPEDGNRAVRKAADLAHSAEASPEGATIKLADLIDNSKSILERDPNFARVYLAEKARLLEVLRHGDATLWARANAIVTKAKSRAARDDSR